MTKPEQAIITLPEEEPFKGETLLADGWVYRDLPRMTPEAMEILVDIIGEDNIRWMTLAEYKDAVRGQVLISPQGLENLKSKDQSND